MTHNAECYWVLSTFRFTGPACFYNPIAEAFAHLSCIGAVISVYLDTSGYCDKPEYIVSVYGITTFGEFEIQSFQVLVNNEYIFFSDCCFVYLVLQVVFFCTAIGHLITFAVPLLLFDVFIQNIVYVEYLIGNLLIKLCHVLESQAFD